MVRRIVTTAALLVSVSCSSSTMDCSLVGFASGITVGTEDGVVATELCLDDTCHPLAFRDGRELIDDEPRTYSYDLTVVIDGDERVLTGEVETRAF